MAISADLGTASPKGTIKVAPASISTDLAQEIVIGIAVVSPAPITRQVNAGPPALTCTDTSAEANADVPDEANNEPSAGDSAGSPIGELTDTPEGVTKGTTKETLA